MTDQGLMLVFQITDRFNVYTRYDQNMHRCGGVDIQESDYLLVLENDRAGAGAIDYLAEDTGWIHKTTFGPPEFHL